MKNDKELFKLARRYIRLMDLYRNAKIGREEFDEYEYEIRNIILEKGYDVDKFVEYQDLYLKMSIEEYYEFIKILD